MRLPRARAMERTFNLWEAGLWLLIALTLLPRALREPTPRRRVLLQLSVVFTIFGVSDLVEARTGAWWEPWWLAVLKVGCGALIGLGFWRYFTLGRPSPPGKPSSREEK